MVYAIVSDIHANLEAFERVLADAARCGAESVVCLGDIVGYGPLPAETLAKVRETAAVAVAGNHDDAVSGRMDAADFTGLASDAVARHRKALSKGDIAYLRSLPHAAAIDGAILAHGDTTAPDRFLYVDSDESAAANFAATDAQLAFVGHTHVPCIHLVGASGKVYRLGPEDFAVEDGKRYIVNAGSVGYPRESGGKCFSTYVIYDSRERTVRFRTLPFAVSSVLQRGAAPAGRRTRTVAAALAVAALGLAAAVIVRTRGQATPAAPEPRQEEAPAIAEVAPAETAPSGPVMEKTLALSASCEHVRANISLSRGSAPALLRIAFLGEDGREMSPVAQTVRQSSSKGFRVPPGAVRARISVYRASEGGAIPEVRFFSPSAK